MTMYEGDNVASEEKTVDPGVCNLNGATHVHHHKQRLKSESQFPCHLTLNGRHVVKEHRGSNDTSFPQHNNNFKSSQSLDALSRDSVNILCEQLGSVGMDDPVKKSKIDDREGVYGANNHAIVVNGHRTCKLDAITVYTQDKDGDTLLHTFIILENIELTMMCINISPTSSWLSTRNLLFQTALHLAVLTNQAAVVRRLVVGGADIEARDKDGNTALHIACRKGFTEIVETLLEPVRYKETSKNKYEIPYQKIPQNFTIPNYEGLACLHLAASNNQMKCVDILISKGVDLNAREGKTGRTILHNACLDGNTDLVKVLLRQPCCNINAHSYDDYTPFDFARARGHNDIIMELAVAGARYGDEDDSD